MTTVALVAIGAICGFVLGFLNLITENEFRLVPQFFEDENEVRYYGWYRGVWPEQSKIVFFKPGRLIITGKHEFSVWVNGIRFKVKTVQPKRQTYTLNTWVTKDSVVILGSIRGGAEVWFKDTGEKVSKFDFDVPVVTPHIRWPLEAAVWILFGSATGLIAGFLFNKPLF